MLQCCIAVVLLLLGISSSAQGTTEKEAILRWVCTSGVSNYTNSFCELEGNIPGCYFVINYNEYRSCGRICNEIIQHSIDEGRCISYCPDYFSTLGKCKLMSLDSTTEKQSPVTAAVIAENTVSDKPSNLKALSVLAALPILVILGFLFYKLWQKKKRQKSDRRPIGAQYNTDRDEVQLLNGDVESGTNSQIHQPTNYGVAEVADPNIQDQQADNHENDGSTSVNVQDGNSGRYSDDEHSGEENTRRSLPNADSEIHSLDSSSGFSVSDEDIQPVFNGNSSDNGSCSSSARPRSLERCEARSRSRSQTPEIFVNGKLIPPTVAVSPSVQDVSKVEIQIDFRKDDDAATDGK